MSGGDVQVIELEEYKAETFARDEIPEEVGKAAWEMYRSEVQVESPSFVTGDRWRLTSKGWVGRLPLPHGFALRLRPRVELGNLFRMLE